MLTKAIARLRQTDWRIFMGIIITALWIVAGIVYLRGGNFSQATIYDIPLQNIGSFLEGAFAPLAFLWLVIGLFIQQRELADNTEVLRQTSIQSEKQTQAIAATEMNARQETFFKIAESVRGQLGGITGMLFISCTGASEGQIVPRERIEKMWHMLARRDDQVFAREFLLFDAEKLGGFEALFYKTEIRRRHTTNFMRTFDRLMVMAENCDSANGIIADSLAQTAHGLLYNRMREHQPDELKVECTSIDTADYEKVLEQTRA
jgi:DNA-binding XRE family transcriptional regulator